MPSDVGRIEFFLVSIFFHRVDSDVGRLKLFLMSIIFHHLMMNSCVVFSYIVTIVSRPRSLVMAKLLLHFLAFQPEETHVCGFCTLGSDGVVDNTEGRGFIGLNWSRWLWMSHQDDRVEGGDGFMAAPSLVSAADDIMDLMIWMTVRTAPLLGGLLELLKKKWPPMRLRSLDSDR